MLHIGGIGEVIVSQQASVTVSAAVRRGRLSVAYSAGPNSSISATGGGISVDVPGNLSHRARTWKVDVATVTSLLLRHQASVTLPEGEPFDVNLSAHGRKVRTPIRSVTYEAKLTTEDGYPALELKTSAETDDVKLGPVGPISAEFSITTTFTIKNKLNPTVSDIEEILAIAAAVLIARGLTPSRPVVDPALDR